MQKQNHFKQDNRPVLTNPQGHILYFDILRIFAAFAIVMLHVASWHWSSLEYQSTTWKIHHFFNGTARWAVPVFIMMSGALFLEPSRSFSVKRIYQKNIWRMLSTYLIWSAFYALVTISKASDFSITYFIGLTIRGHYHLWFLIMLISLYILVPVLRKVAEERELLRYGILSGVVLIFFVPSILQVMSQSDLDAIKKFGTSLSEVFPSTVFTNDFSYILYFLLGYYLHTFDFSPKQRILCYLMLITGLILTFVLPIRMANKSQISTGDFYAPESLNVLLMSVGMFVFGKYVLSGFQSNEKTQSVFRYVSECGLTVYLVHVFVMDSVFAIGCNSFSFHPIISIPILSLVIFLISLAISMIIEWIKRKVTCMIKTRW